MSFFRRALRLTVNMAAMILIGGCGSSSSSTAGPSAPKPAAPIDSATQEKATAPNACDVLDEAVAKKYLGDGAQLRRKAQPNPHESQCQYASTNGIITIMAGEWKFVHTPTPLDKPASGLGDEAYESPSGLCVRKGDRGISINVMVMSGEFWGNAADDVNAQTIAAERKVAPDLLTRL